MRAPLVVLAACGLVMVGCSVESKFAEPKRAVHVAIAHDGATSIDGKSVSEREVSFSVLVATLERLRAGGVNDIALGVILASSDPTAKASGAPPAPAGPATGPTPPPRAQITPGTKWDCPFPASSTKGEANVLVVVHVEPDGKPVSADVLEDPGNGFGEAAKKCALEKAYVAAHDVNGQPVRAATFPFYIHFVAH
jgi:hypothetical protein